MRGDDDTDRRTLTRMVRTGLETKTANSRTRRVNDAVDKKVGWTRIEGSREKGGRGVKGDGFQKIGGRLRVGKGHLPVARGYRKSYGHWKGKEEG